MHLVDQPRRLDARQLGAGGAIDVERRVRMPLEERRRDLDVDLAFDGALDDARLVLAGRDDRDLTRVENRRDAHRHRLARHVLLAEEIGRGVAPRHGVERDEPGAALGAGAGFVEADVSRFPDAENLKVDAAGALDRQLVRCAASSISVRGRSPGGMCTFSGLMSMWRTGSPT